MSSDSRLPIDALIDDAQRMLAICNACRYCEGFCAVFPALERRLAFTENDVHYLANLCHNCGACLYACQYAPPHEFQLNFPRMLAQVRKETYVRYAWPGALGVFFRRNALAVSLVTALCLAAVFLFSAAYANPIRFYSAWSDAEGSFYALIPHSVMVAVFGSVFAFAIVAFIAGFVRFWPDMGEETLEFVRAPQLSSATWDAMGLRYLDGGGEGCTYPDERVTFGRKHFHHATFYGFLLCFAATSVATIYHYVFGLHAPYALFSLPVLLGIVGGLGLLVGPAGLLWLKLRSDPELRDRSQDGMDIAFLAMLFATSATGLALLFLRQTALMGVLLAVHLGFVLALFLTLPYGKFVHGLYRFAALVRFHIERRRPLPGLGPE
jgi:citrate/tricarballylate utilization protein